MVNFTDLKFYKSEDGLGGPIDLDEPIQTATPNNLFINFKRDELIPGAIKYKCFYMKNESAEDMENFKIWISSPTPLDYTDIDMAFDTLVNPFDGAVGFNGVNDYVDCTNDSALWSRTLTKFSFSVWVYPTEGGDGNQRLIVSHGDTSNNSFRLYIDSSDPHAAKFVIKDSAGSNYVAAAENLEQFAWNLLTCSFDNSLGSQNVRIYRNGILEDSDDFTGSINLSATLTIAGPTNDFKGYIKDFRFWHDQSVNEAEGLELYEDGEISQSAESYHITFNEKTGTTSRDTVSRTKLATFVNGTFWKNNAQTISDTFEEPDVRANTWYAAGDIESKTFKLRSGGTIPVWVRVTVGADPSATTFENDNGIFSIKFEVTSTGTGSGGTPGTGGGTGGSPPTTSTAYKIAFAGDWGNTGDTTDVVNLMRDQDYDLIIGLGDNAYDDSSASSWCNKFNGFRNKMESAFGNHEYEEDGGIGPYKNFFGYSKTYNSIRFQNCLILILDTNDDKSGVDLDAQRTWAKNELERYKNDARVVWRIAACHHPWFGTGGKHEENEFNQVQKFHKLFTDYDVNFIYTGHNHNWHRSHQVGYNSGDPEDPNLVDGTSPYSRTGNGIIQVNSGMGGHDDPGGSYSLPDADSFWAYRNKSNNGVHELVASNNGNTLTGRFRNIDNNTSDTFTITA